MATRDDILTLLLRETLTINELAQRLELARNAIVLPIQQLEAEGVVIGSTRKEKRAGKPALEYRLAEGTEDVSSTAYPPFSELLMESLPEHLTTTQIADLMDNVGKKMAGRLDTKRDHGFDERLKAATDFVDDLGAATLVERSETGTIVRSFSCPLGRAVRREPCVCKAVSAFFAAATGGRVKQQCKHEDRLECRFLIETRH